MRVGVGYRHEIGPRILANVPPIEALEVVVEHYIYGSQGQREALLALPDHCPVFLHGVGLSIGTALAPPLDLLETVREYASRVEAPWYSEHLAFTNVPGLDLSQLLPLPRTVEVLEVVCENVVFVQDYLKLPLLLENVAYYFQYPDNELDEFEFLLEICRRTGAGMLLDLENLRVNSLNHQYDPFAIIDSLPQGAVRAVHLAGGTIEEGVFIDSHDRPVPVEDLDLLRQLLVSQHPDVILLERDQNLEAFQEILEDVRQITAIRDQAVRRAQSTPGPTAGSVELPRSAGGF
jgi:uncharacterized protein (UPF0276 family)